jgi:bifunctional non-homologous end joining protein LigD
MTLSRLGPGAAYLRFNTLEAALAKLPVQTAIIDGEIISVDAQGKSQFNELFNRKAQPILYAFDLLWLNGEDLRQEPLIVRKDKLAGLVLSSDCKRIMYAQHVEKYGKQLFAEICDKDLEGIVAKRKLSIYKDDRTGWLKIKNRSYSQAKGRHGLMTRAK